MVFKVGDNVKYESGDWLFYGTVTAIIENSITPCYRLNVERMEKKKCTFSITQFEFELALDSDLAIDKEKLKWENSEIEYLKQIQEIKSKIEPPAVIEVVEKVEEIPIPQIETISGAWDRNFVSFQKGERNNAIYTWINRNRRLFQLSKLPQEKLDLLKSINFPFKTDKKKDQIVIQEKVEQPQQLPTEKPKKTHANAWERNLELYKKGEKSNNLYAWISRNRKMYHANKLSEDQLSKLSSVNFPFDVSFQEKTVDSWEKQFRLWKNGNRNRSLQVWRERSVKRFVQGKLPQGKIDKLKEIGILK